MIQHYSKVALRNLMKYKTQNLISTIGLAVGLLCFSICFYCSRYMQSVDQCFNNYHRLVDINLADEGRMLSGTPAILAEKLTKEYVWLAYHAMRANYKNFNIAIHEDYAKDIPPVRLIPQDFSRAVLNVMNNACYAVWRKWQDTPEGYSPEITVSLEKLDKRIVLTIRDNGEGMSPEVKQRLFDSFFTTKPVGQGTGLGMSIVRDIIENKHHGKVLFDSVQHEYTCFRFIIPVT